jgi:hypothetical protein
MTKDEVQLEALNATKGKHKCSIVLGTGEIINLKK